MLHLLEPQEVTNCHLYQQIQLNNISQQAQVDNLGELTASNYQRNFDYILALIGEKRSIFEWLKRLETACLQSGCGICTKALRTARGIV